MEDPSCVFQLLVLASILDVSWLVDISLQFLPLSSQGYLTGLSVPMSLRLTLVHLSLIYKNTRHWA